MNSDDPEYEEVEESQPLEPQPYIDLFPIRTILLWIARNSNTVIEHSTVFVNLFHLIILLQKELRSNSIFILTIGICISDIIGFIVIFYYLGVDRNNYQSMINQFRVLDVDFLCYTCMEEVDQFVKIDGAIKATILNSTRPISIWLAILMAMIRTLSIIFPMSNRVQKLTKPINAVFMVLGVCVFWIFYYSWDLFLIEYWFVPDHLVDEGCILKIRARKNPYHYYIIRSKLFFLIGERESVEYLVRLIPTMFYPVLTVSLLIELCRIRKKRKIDKMKSEKSDNTTVLILFMTLSFMLSEGLEGVSSLSIAHWSESYANFVSQTEVFNNLRSFNAFSHCFVCFLMSSQYRECVKRIFCFWRPKKKTMMVKSCENTASQTFQTIHSKTV